MLNQWIIGKALFLRECLHLDREEVHQREAILKDAYTLTAQMQHHALVLRPQGIEERRRRGIEREERNERQQILVKNETALATYSSKHAAQWSAKSMSYALALWCIEQVILPGEVATVEIPGKATSLTVLERYAVFGKPRFFPVE